MPETPSSDTHPYGLRADLLLGSNIELSMPEIEVSHGLGEFTLRLCAANTNAREQANNLKRVTATLEAFSSPSEAERVGRWFAASLLWVAVSKRVTLTFERWYGDEPVALFERDRSPGFSVRAEGRAFWPVSTDEFCSLAEQLFRSQPEVSTDLLVSMQFYAAARLEVTQIARFVTLMTALEALSVQRDYGDQVAAVLDSLALELDAHESLAGDAQTSLRQSLMGRMRQLRQESVRQAILRTVKTYSEGGEVVRFIDEAYGVRSKILHEGARVANLDDLIQRTESIIRSLYSRRLRVGLAQD
jgi:hypothetical protein